MKILMIVIKNSLKKKQFRTSNKKQEKALRDNLSYIEKEVFKKDDN